MMCAARFRSNVCLALACLVALALFASCRRRTAPRPQQPPAPLALLFVAAEKASSGIRDERTLYAVGVEDADLAPRPILTKQGLGIARVVQGRYVILSGYDFPENAASAKRQTFLYRHPDATVEQVQSPSGPGRDDEPEVATTLSVSRGPLQDLRVRIRHIPSMRIEEWPVPSGLAESPVGSMSSLRFHSRMSPDSNRLALFVQPLGRDHAALTSSLVVLERGGTGARVLDAGLWPEWGPFASWSTGPSLEWVDDRRLVYVDRRGDSREAGEYLLKMADATTGRVRALGRSSPALFRDSRTGEISFGAAGGKRQVLDVPRRGLEARIRQEPCPERFTTSRTDDRKTEILRDTATGTEIWRGPFPALGRRYVSPDGTLLAFTVRPNKTESIDEVYVYDPRTGGTQRVSSGYVTGLLHWVGGPPCGHD